ncbi:TPA: baseplate assembly protein [Escherichia coli]|nr:baseplate assembly protein [Escherichia coli]HAW3269866.1 baseplate assembly protein [Escherichia coli]
MSARFLGMNPEATGTLSDTNHLWNSVRDILLTPLASRVMRREYGSLLPDLLDAPMNATTRLQCMSAVVIALTQWEPRIALNAVDIQWEAGGKAVITLTGTLTESLETVQNTLTLGSDNASR